MEVVDGGLGMDPDSAEALVRPLREETLPGRETALDWVSQLRIRWPSHMAGP
ncbi:MAG: hypothetical protein R3D29_03305 [Nitratireductor sp.]